MVNLPDIGRIMLIKDLLRDLNFEEGGGSSSVVAGVLARLPLVHIMFDTDTFVLTIVFEPLLTVEQAFTLAIELNPDQGSIEEKDGKTVVKMWWD
jgi:hypothetical protein